MLKIFALKKNKKAIADLGKYKKILSAAEKIKAKKIARIEDVESFVLGRYLLRNVLSQYLDNVPGEIIINLNKYGKPCLDDKKLKYNFSLSHAGEWIILALSEGGAVGVDIEKIKTIDLSIAKEFFLQPEIDYIFKRSDEKLKRFYRVWTLRESYLKCLGMGLHYPLANFYFQIGSNIEVIDKSVKKDYKFRFFNIPNNYLLAVCLADDFSPVKIDFVKINSYD